MKSELYDVAVWPWPVSAAFINENSVLYCLVKY